MNKLKLALRMFRRNAKSIEARVLLVALLIAVMSVTTVSFFADRVESALNRQANELISAVEHRPPARAGRHVDAEQPFARILAL